jgi:predicted ArsR family transcriptional regulator
MNVALIEDTEGTRRALMRALLRNKRGLTVQGMAHSLRISRNAVRQHLTALERDGFVAKGRIQPSGGRPEQLYVLSDRGNEQFARQYSWFSELLLQMLQAQNGSAGLSDKLAELGRSVAGPLTARLAGASGSPERIAAVAATMREIGYDAAAREENGEQLIEAHNCVFHQLAAKCPEVCSFDLALLSASTGCQVEHRSCMVRGGDACRFSFRPNETVAPGAAEAPVFASAAKG